MVTKNQNSANSCKCEYCGKTYAKQSTLFAHMCTQKERALQKDEKRVRYGLYAFNRFNKLCLRKSDATYEQFCKDKFYNSFVKFGSYISNVKPLYPEKYIDYVVTSGKKIKDWTDDAMYETYVQNLIKTETTEVALERSIGTMIEWSGENKSVWYKYFDEVSTNKAMWDIRDGKVSPWLVLNTQKGKHMLNSFDDKQLELVYNIIDPEFWSSQFKLKRKDLDLVRLLSEEFSL